METNSGESARSVNLSQIVTQGWTAFVRNVVSFLTMQAIVGVVYSVLWYALISPYTSVACRSGG